MHPKSLKILKCQDAFTFVSNLPDINFPYMPLNFKMPEIEIKEGWNINSKNYELCKSFIFKTDNLSYTISVMTGQTNKIHTIFLWNAKIQCSIKHYRDDKYHFYCNQNGQGVDLIIPQDLLANTIKYAKENKGLISFI